MIRPPTRPPARPPARPLTPSVAALPQVLLSYAIYPKPMGWKVVSGGLLVFFSLALFPRHKRPHQPRRAKTLGAKQASPPTPIAIVVQAGAKPAPPGPLPGERPLCGNPFAAAAWDEPEVEGEADVEMGGGSLSRCSSQLSFAEWSSLGASSSLASELSEQGEGEEEERGWPLTLQPAYSWAELGPGGPFVEWSFPKSTSAALPSKLSEQLMDVLVLPLSPKASGTWAAVKPLCPNPLATAA